MQLLAVIPFDPDYYLWVMGDPHSDLSRQVATLRFSGLPLDADALTALEAMRHRISADLLLANGQQDAAIAEYRRALAINPEMVDACYTLSHLYLLRKQYPQAAETLQKLCEIDATKENFYNLGNADFSLQQFVKAKAAYQQALALDENYLDALRNLGVTCIRLNDYAAAETALLKVLALQPNDPLAGNCLRIVYQATGRNAQAATPRKG